MSGHSKWSTIKRDKGLNDARRGQAFTKAANAVSAAAREGGGNPDMNFKLRLAIEAARAVNMPKENIERAIARGAGGAGEEALESITYEGYAPNGVAVMVEAVTDNKQRTAAQIRSIFEKNNGSLGGPGSVAWMFTTVGALTLKVPVEDSEAVALEAVDQEAVDFETEADNLILYAEPQNLEILKKWAEEKGLVITNSEVIKNPTTTVKLADSKTANSVLGVIEKLEELDDVQKVYANFDIPDQVLQEAVG